MIWVWHNPWLTALKISFYLFYEMCLKNDTVISQLLVWCYCWSENRLWQWYHCWWIIKKMQMITPDYTIFLLDKTNKILESWKFNRRFVILFPEVWNVFKSIELTNGKKYFRYIWMERTNNRQHNPIILSIWAMRAGQQTCFVTKTYAHERKIANNFNVKS